MKRGGPRVSDATARAQAERIAETIKQRRLGPRHKFNARPTEHNGVRYDSKMEARYAAKLDMLKASGQLLGYLRQVPFHLPGGVRYVCDFQEFWADGRVVFTEVKGMETATYKAKRRMVDALYPWADIQTVKRVK